ncbi:MAG: hypothetical protein ACYS8W_12585 [Planctomycetota bacterium]|jgi:hypothetical protein
MKLLRPVILSFCALLLIILPAASKDGDATPPGGAEQGKPASDLPEKIDEAIKSGTEWLKKQQNADGSFSLTPDPFPAQGGYTFPSGSTALCLFALLKCGVKPNDPAITKGFNYIRNFRSTWKCNKAGDAKYDTIYSASCVVLALEALHTVPVVSEKEKEKREKEKDKWSTFVPDEADKKAKPRWNSPQGRKDHALIREYINWICRNREGDGRWRYPRGMPTGYGDLSNCQYAMLALNAARRLKINHPKDVYEGLCEYLLREQEKTGPKVEPAFPVPVADHPISKLKKMQKEYLKKITQLVDKCRKLEKKGEDPLKDPSNNPRTYLEEEQEKIFGVEKADMFSRGWCYQLEDKLVTDPSLKRDWKQWITGSMTTSGVICMVGIKDALEKTPYGKKKGKEINKSIRDGCAWMAHNFKVTANPGGERTGWHHYYFLYGLERAAVLAMVPAFGKHEWFKEGAGLLIKQQRRDGSWLARQGTSGPNIDTCFALLFLKRATTPLVRIPGDRVTWTGEGLRKK